MLRHLVPVGGVPTLVQGLAAPALAQAVSSHPRAALAVQSTLLGLSVMRRLLSQWHSERDPARADRVFEGHAGPDQKSGRRGAQATHTAGIAIGDIAAVVLTGVSMRHPALQSVAAAAAAIQSRAHALSQAREFTRPLISTVAVGNPAAEQPSFGHNLRASDVTPPMKLAYGSAVFAIEFGAQMGMNALTKGLPLWKVPRGRAVSAAAIAGLGNTMASSVADHLIESAQARRMREMGVSHVRRTRVLDPDVRNPLQWSELKRQFERVDTRVFNQMVPSLIAMAVFEGIRRAFPQFEPSSPEHDHLNTPGAAMAAAIVALANGVILGALMATTARMYQLNDELRNHPASAAQAADA